MKYGRKRQLENGCSSCGNAFKPGERIVVLKAARTVPYYSSGDCAYNFDAKPPLMILHENCWK